MPNEWIQEISHPQLQGDEARNWLGKYGSAEEALVGGFNAQKMTGKPFKLPETMEAVDNWPDEKDRDNFRRQLSGLTGGVYETEDELDHLNFAEGLADARTANEELVKAFKAFAVEKKIPKPLVPKLIAFNNTFSQATINNQEKDRIETAKTVNQKLSELYGGEEGLQINTERVKRLFQNHAGLTADEYEHLAEGLIKTGITQDALVCKALFNIAKGIVKEGETEPPKTTKTETKKPTLKDRLPNSYDWIRLRRSAS